jgi:integration host factor subunit beta
MIRSELVQRLATSKPHLMLSDVQAAVDTIFGEIAARLAQGDRVEIRGFGSFTVRRRAPRRGRNPRTGESVDVGATHRLHFRMSKELFARVIAPGPAEAAGRA